MKTVIGIVNGSLKDGTVVATIYYQEDFGKNDKKYNYCSGVKCGSERIYDCSADESLIGKKVTFTYDKRWDGKAVLSAINEYKGN